MTMAPTHIKGPVWVSRISVQGPMTSIAARYSGLQRPSLSDKAPNSGDDMTASSMGSVLTKPDSVGSTPCCCKKVGPKLSTAISVMLKTRKAAKNSRMLGFTNSP